PRPPQPTRPTLSRLLWPANRLGARARPPATAEAVRKSRRVAGVSVMGGGSGVGCGRGPRGHMTYRSYGTYRSYRPGGNNLVLTARGTSPGPRSEGSTTSWWRFGSKGPTASRSG